jgi:hypothetical protein
VRRSDRSTIRVTSPTSDLAVTQCEDVPNGCVTSSPGVLDDRGKPGFCDHIVTGLNVAVEGDIAIDRALPNGMEEIVNAVCEVSKVRHGTGP